MSICRVLLLTTTLVALLLGRSALAEFTPTSDFTDNGDGTVTHSLTGLTWQRCAIGQTWNATGASCDGTPTTVPWADAATTASASTVGGQSDWRLPAVWELRTIVDFDQEAPAINSEIFPGVTGGDYWSATQSVIDTAQALRVSFANGEARRFDVTQPLAIRAVRGGTPVGTITTPDADLVDNGDGTVTHSRTGLTWQRCTYGQSWNATSGSCEGTSSRISWAEAAAVTSDLAGYSDWRMPDIQELNSLIEYSTFEPAINTTRFPATEHAEYWSATKLSSNVARVHVHYLFDGDSYTIDSSVASYLRLVRADVLNAAFTATPTSGTAPLTVALDAASSTAGRGGAIASYAWSSSDGQSASGATASLTFASSGSYQVTLTVTDDGGATASSSQTVTVAEQQPPVAVITPSVNAGTIPLSVTVSGASSTDPDGTISEYAWTLPNSQTATGAEQTFTIETTGSFEVTLTVTDDSGLTNTATTTITTRAAPVIRVTVSPLQGPTPLEVQVDASDSTDPDGTIASYSWSTSDGQTLDEASGSFTFNEAGSGQVVITLVVTDNNGDESSDSYEISLFDRPQAKAVVTPVYGEAPLEVQLDGSGSTAGSASIDSYRWSSSDRQSVDSVSGTMRFDQAGNYRITLIVTDANGVSDQTESLVRVVEPESEAGSEGGSGAINSIPLARIALTPSRGVTPLTVRLDGSSSSDGDGEVTAWSWSSCDGSRRSGAQTSLTLSQVGSCEITLTVTDDAGATATARRVVEVLAVETSSSGETDTGLAISPVSAWAVPGELVSLRAIGANGTVHWALPEEELETTSGAQTGFRPSGEGVYHIWASDGESFAVAVVDSRSVDEEMVRIRPEPATLILARDEARAFSVRGYRKDGSWIELRDQVALGFGDSRLLREESDGSLAGVASGSTTITLRYGSLSATLPVTVNEARTLLQAEPRVVRIDQGERAAVAVYRLGEDGLEPVSNPRFESSDSQVATIEGGEVVAVASGSASLIVTDGTGSLRVPVEVRPTPPPAILPQRAEIEFNESLTFEIAGGTTPFSVVVDQGVIDPVDGRSYRLIPPDVATDLVVTATDANGNITSGNYRVVEPVVVTPQVAAMAVGETIQLSATGGDGRYQWSVTQGELSGEGARVSYQAPQRAGPQTVVVRDGGGRQREVGVLVGSTFALTPSLIHLDPGAESTFELVGGSPPFAVRIAAGEARVEGSELFYRAPDVAGTYTITVSDSSGAEVVATAEVQLSLLITPREIDIQPGESITFNSVGGFGEPQWEATRGILSLSGSGEAEWEAPRARGISRIHVSDAAGQVATAIARVSDHQVAVTPSNRHLQPGEEAIFSAVGGTPPFVWVAEVGDIVQLDDQSIRYTAPAVRGTYELVAVDQAGNEALAEVAVFSTSLRVSPQRIYLAAGEEATFTLSGGTGSYTIWSALGEGSGGKVEPRQLNLAEGQSGATGAYAAPTGYLGNDSILIRDSGGNLATIAVELVRVSGLIGDYLAVDGQVDDEGMAQAIDDYFTGAVRIERSELFELIDLYLDDRSAAEED